ncbi:1-deoxy-D-xylulose-5-phosphate synthase [Campylobacter sp. RM9344]|uniref:1-deoxy-D-xylulose-5-phosphate synthase n=1 Tax=Campylobacter californiensis TaxID=1032243 RepID=A0AAW3ZRM8_9BACT|nr:MULTISPECIES: 1-deoxy-D-xylulose-5-phosphate synthase [unclassified Campylobacter]MBE2984158.1 1-deoxy-D-xylulose-5-phosphate synthase [Campylobacter sp. RM6883]MBE2986218.1 1-deoxy-D-xylulose-5-phosphate synthase [Campylobacter sp. RM12919]MBE2988215.1 1-deoxy-D-xylulose-5-phosphate synthase [Campylobacter sp. RM12920]MBE2995528.1 1-deoxy-D-xylulose-5-phosphate synthase [Campylobacter sp. RM6913]MBE3022627.1 1-deoxy-D-xylulose-5-phosphate synthase [Campylobacter sp. 7477a]MBE3029803.1 1-d
MDIKRLNLEELNELCHKLRDKILQTVSKNGGHLSSNIGAVEIIVAMHYIFDVKKDPFIFDVSHQSYAHKLLTGRWDQFDTLRKFGGVSGYTKPSESKFDYFIAGHSSTSISLAVGAAKAIKLKNEDRIPVAIIGDGSLSGGMAYEALNELGDRKYPCVIVLNDNEMSISKPIGALSKYLSQMMAGQFYQKFKGRVEKFLEYMPDGAAYMARRMEEGIRLITPGMFFEELGLEYIGPVNGHDLSSLLSTFETAKAMRKPVIVHVQTLKGKGYEYAEGYLAGWHGVGPFDLKSGEFIKKQSNKSATAIFSEHLLKMAGEHSDIVGVTAAMPTGTGLDALIEKFPERFWDVAIAEQHAVTSMSAMAKEGFKPFVAIYSTFMQRAYDQLIHDACIQKLNITFAMDRAGIVGEDGETHQGAFDISFLNAIPNVVMFAPRCETSMKKAMEFAYRYKGVSAFRYPRGAFGLNDEFEAKDFRLGKGEILIKGSADTAIICYGNAVAKGLSVRNLLKDSLDVSLVDLVFVKPLDKEMLLELSKSCKKWYIISDSAKKGGVGEILSAFLQDNRIYDVSIASFEYNDAFIPHGNTAEVENYLGISAEQIAQKLLLDN